MKLRTNIQKALDGVLKSSLAAATLALLVATSPAQAGAPVINTGIAPPNSTPYSQTYSEWAASWLQWALSIPADQSPLLDTTGEFCHVGQSGPVFFLAGNFGGTTVRQCTVPEGKALFFPLLNFFWVQTPFDPPYTIEELRDIVGPPMDGAILTCEIDGRPIKNLSSYREESVVFTTTLPEGNLFGIDAGDYAPCLDNGYYLMLWPLKKGRHTIHFTGETADHSFAVDVTYYLTVE